MKKINWKDVIITTIICLLPMILGVIYYNDVPEQIAVHFNIQNEPDSYAHKSFALFAIPALMAVLQFVLCIISDLREENKSKRPKLFKIAKLIIPTLSIIVYSIMLMFSLGNNVDIRRVICFVIGIIFMLMGNYFPKITTQNSMNFNPRITDEKLLRKTTRMIGVTFVILGILMLISILFDSIFSIVVLTLLVLIMPIEAIYSVYLNRKLNIKERKDGNK